MCAEKNNGVIRMIYSKCIKRVFDVIIALLSIIIFSPIIIVTAILVRIKMGKPILFYQERVTKGEKVFKLFKFRSMTNARNEQGELLDESQRLTKFGAAIRSLSLDELPELFHILTGKMSFIGPRPLPTYYMPYYKDEEKVRHRVRGGLVPADTICGKAITTWDEQLAWDAYYAKNCSFVLDMRILFLTFKVLFDRSKNDYGSVDRPHLNEERSGVKDVISR